MKLALDTNRYVDLMRPVPEAVALIESADSVYVPFVVIAELRSGFLGGTQRSANERILMQFLRRTGVQMLFADEMTTLIYAELYVDLRRRGRKIPQNDLWVAALCI